MDTFEFPFTAAQLTDEVNLLPRTWGRITQSGMFRFSGVGTTQIRVQRRHGKIGLLSSEPRGAPGAISTLTRGEEKSLLIPHFPHEASIGPEDIQDRVMWGSRGMTMESLANVTREKLVDIRTHYDITGEYLRMSALQGVLKDGSNDAGFDFFGFFGLTQKSVDFDLGTPTTNVQAKCRDVVAHIEDHILDDVFTGVVAECDPDFFDALLTHPNVEKYFLQHAGAQALVTAQEERRFSYGQIQWREYRASAPDSAGNPRKFVPQWEATTYPTGTRNTFRGAVGPAHHIAEVNRPGQEIHISTEIRKHGRGVEMFCQANMLPYCVRPEVLVRVHTSTHPAP